MLYLSPWMRHTFNNVYIKNIISTSYHIIKEVYIVGVSSSKGLSHYAGHIAYDDNIDRRYITYQNKNLELVKNFLDNSLTSDFKDVILLTEEKYNSLLLLK